MGVTSLAQLNPSWVRPAQPVRRASQTNGYPWFEERTRKKERKKGSGVFS